jgi:hypothetical protein
VIRNAGNLYWFAENINNGNIHSSSNIWLDNDIVIGQTIPFNTVTGKFEGDLSKLRKWIPIGIGDNAFSGNVYGNGHSIEGLYVESKYDNYIVGFIGFYGGGTISDLNITNSYFGISVIDNIVKYGGSIVGLMVDGNMVNCSSSATIEVGQAINGGIAPAIIGGLVGSLEYSTVENSVFRGKILINDYSNAGGLVGNSICRANYGAVI